MGTIRLSRLIDKINERFGTEFTDADQLFFDQIAEAAIGDESLQQAAQVNPDDKFALVFNRVLESLFVERLEQNEEIFAQFMHDPEFQGVIKNSLIRDVYRRLRDNAQKLMAAESVVPYES